MPYVVLGVVVYNWFSPPPSISSPDRCVRSVACWPVFWWPISPPAICSQTATSRIAQIAPVVWISIVHSIANTTNAKYCSRGTLIRANGTSWTMAVWLRCRHRWPMERIHRTYIESLPNWPLTWYPVWPPIRNFSIICTFSIRASKNRKRCSPISRIQSHSIGRRNRIGTPFPMPAILTRNAVDPICEQIPTIWLKHWKV